MPASSPYPPAPPTVTGTALTVDLFLRTPALVQRAVRDLTLQRFVADVIFAGGPAAVGGSVIHDQVLASDLFLDRDVQEIAPGSEFPILNGADTPPLVALARKFGGEVFLTDEQVRRDRRDVLNREMTRLRNTIVRKVDTLAIAALLAAPVVTAGASGDWSTAATDIAADIAVAKSAVENQDLGYEVDTALVNPAQHLDMLKDKDIRDALPRERDDSLIRTGNIGRILGVDFVSSNRVPAGTVIFLQRKIAGAISDEVPMYARTYREERPERVFVHGARIPAIYVTDPKAVFVQTGS